MGTVGNVFGLKRSFTFCCGTEVNKKGSIKRNRSMPDTNLYEEGLGVLVNPTNLNKKQRIHHEISKENIRSKDEYNAIDVIDVIDELKLILNGTSRGEQLSFEEQIDRPKAPFCNKSTNEDHLNNTEERLHVL